MRDYDSELIERFMAGNTENMDIHEHAGEVLRKEIARLRMVVDPQDPEATIVRIVKHAFNKGVGYASGNVVGHDLTNEDAKRVIREAVASIEAEWLRAGRRQ